jgi:hypothetical protein
LCQAQVRLLPQMETTMALTALQEAAQVIQREMKTLQEMVTETTSSIRARQPQTSILT